LLGETRMNVLAIPRTLLRAVDMPAREALLMSHRPPIATLAPAMIGGVLIVATSSIAVRIPLQDGASMVPALDRVDLLLPLVQALAIVLPTSLILGVYARLDFSPRTVIAAYALGALIAGLVLVSALPLVAFLAVVSRARPLVPIGIMFPAIAAAAIAATVKRILSAIDPSPRARAHTLIVAAALMAAFFVRAYAALGRSTP
jgi:hypothetical protein